MRRLTALAGAALLVLAACSDDSAVSTTSDRDSTTTAAGAATSIAPTTTAPVTATTVTPAPSWSRIQGMAFPRSEMPAAVLDGLIYVPGGFMGTAQGGAEGRAEVEAYDPTTDSWERTVPLLEARHHLMTVAMDGRLWVIGGFGSPGFGGIADTVWSWAPGEDEWTDHAPLPEPVGAAGAAALDGFIYVAGGQPAGDSLLRYDPATDTWETLTPMPTPREHVAAVAFGGAIWVIGGRWAGGEWASVDVYDPATDTWEPGPDLIRARGGFGATVWQGTIVVAGGEVLDSLETLTSVEVLVDGGWTEFDPMPVALHGNAAVALDGRLYVLGGSRRAGAIANSGDALVWAG